MMKPKVVLLIFVSGKIVLTGAKVREEIYMAFNQIYSVLVGELQMGWGQSSGYNPYMDLDMDMDTDAKPEQDLDAELDFNLDTLSGHSLLSNFDRLGVSGSSTSGTGARTSGHILGLGLDINCLCVSDTTEFRKET